MPLAIEPVLDGVHNMTAAGLHAMWLTVSPEDLAQIEKRHVHFTAENGAAGFTYIRMIFRKPLTAVFAMCGGILLLACMNLASLLMARGAARQPELATRLALGATRRRLIQQLLVESLLIALMGAAAGLAVAPLISKSLAVMLLGGPGDQQVDTSLDIRVFAFAALASIVASLLVGLVPALQATSKGLNEQIKSGQHITQAHERRRILPKIMMAGEVALALMLVVGAGLLASSLVRLYLSGAGFDPSGLDNISFSLDKQPLKGEAVLEFYRRLEDGLRRQPGVTSVSFARMVPFTHFVWDEPVAAGAGKPVHAYFNQVSPDYFQTMRIPLLSGRDVSWSDTLPPDRRSSLTRQQPKAFFPIANRSARPSSM